MSHQSEVESRIAEMERGLLGVQGAARALPQLLREDEVLLSLGDWASFIGSWRARMGILALTDQRVLFIINTRSKVDSVEWPLPHIGSIDYKFVKKMMIPLGEVHLRLNDGSTVEFVSGGQNDARRFVERFRQLRGGVPVDKGLLDGELVKAIARADRQFPPDDKRVARTVGGMQEGESLLELAINSSITDSTLVTITDRAVLLADASALRRIQLAEIQSVSVSRSNGRMHLMIYMDHEVVDEVLSDADADRLLLALKTALKEVSSTGSPPQDVAVESTNASAIELLRQLAQLHEDGILSTSEYESKKAEIIARL